MKAKISDIVPGRILWEVSCIDGRFCGKGKDFDTIPHKVIVLSKPIYKDGVFNEPSPFFQNEKTFLAKGVRDPFITNSLNSLYDLGFNDKHVYNLHRLFTSHESALDYIEQCKAGVFTDPVDQEYYDKTSTEQYRKIREEEDRCFDELLQDLFYSYDY